MVDKKLSELDAITSADDDDLLYIVGDSPGKKITKINFQKTANVHDAQRLAHGMFITGIHNNTATYYAHTFISLDGINWTIFGNSPISATSVRDPALLHYDDLWWLICTNGSNYLTAFNSSDLLTWSAGWSVSTAGVSPTATWAPSWFIDNDNSVHVIVGLQVSSKFAIYEMHPTNRGMTTWSTPVKISDAGFPNNCVDPFILRVGNIYYMFFKDQDTGYIDLANSSTLLSGYTVTQTGNWASWGTSIEGPSISQMDDGRWRIYYTNNSGLDALGIYYSETIDSTFATGWSAKVLITSLNGYNHPMPVRIIGTLDLWRLLIQHTHTSGSIDSDAASDGYVLTANGAGGAAWEASPVSDITTDPIWDTKGDLVVGTGSNTAAKLAAGTNGKFLKADSGEVTGLLWDTPTGAGDVVGPTESVNGNLAVFDGTTGKLLKDGGSPTGGGDMTWASILASQLVNEIKGWPPIVNAGDLDALNLWWDKVGTPTTAPTIQDTSAAGLTDDYELCLKVVADAASEGLYQRFTFADEPRVKLGRKLSTLWAIWCVSGVGVTLSLTNSDASETAATKVTAAAWTIVEVPNHTLAGTYCDVKLVTDGAGTFYAVPLGVNIGARGIPLPPRPIRHKDIHATLTADADSGGTYNDVDCTTAASPLCLAVITQILFQSSNASACLLVRRNGDTTNDSTIEVIRLHAANVQFDGFTKTFVDDGNIFEFSSNGAAGDTEHIYVWLRSYEEWA
jgi:hypothetical protein